jgi:hypothetical protein
MCVLLVCLGAAGYLIFRRHSASLARQREAQRKVQPLPSQVSAPAPELEDKTVGNRPEEPGTSPPVSAPPESHQATLSPPPRQAAPVRRAPQMQIQVFEAVPFPGDPCKTILRWTADGATQASIEPVLGAVTPASGYRLVQPATTTRYTLTATGPDGTASRNLTVTVPSACISAH